MKAITPAVVRKLEREAVELDKDLKGLIGLAGDKTTSHDEFVVKLTEVKSRSAEHSRSIAALN